ncbi:hypothetical protein TNCV_3206221 [Trichonephila clavipes]|nr:hypothetical protein TNCV_3206221 [Trichonephila clavipes]
MFMTNVIYNGVTFTKLGRLINERKMGGRLQDTRTSVSSGLSPLSCQAWRWICRDIGSRSGVLCWTNRNPERKGTRREL